MRVVNQIKLGEQEKWVFKSEFLALNFELISEKRRNKIQESTKHHIFNHFLNSEALFLLMIIASLDGGFNNIFNWLLPYLKIS